MKKKSASSKKWWLILGLILIFLSVYLNRAYSRIYQFTPKLGLVEQNFSKVYFFYGNSASPTSVKYAAVGDSLTAGIGASKFEETFPYIYGYRLTQNYRTVGVKNYGIPGVTTGQLISYELDEVVKDQPDLITLFTGTNDMRNFVDEKVFQQNFTDLVKTLKTQTKARIIILNLPFLGSSKSIYFPYNLYFDLKTRQFNKFIESVAKKEGLQYVDLYTPTLERSKKPDFYSEDDFHPSGAGYKFWANLIPTP